LEKDLPRAESSLFVLSGEEITLPFAEINALLSTYSNLPETHRYGSRIVTSSVSDPNSIHRISDRAAYCRFGGALISKTEKISSLADPIKKDLISHDRTFAVRSLSLSLEQCGGIGEKIKNITNQRVSLENPDYLFQAEEIPDGFVLAFSDHGEKKFTWRNRRPRARKFFLPSAIYPKLARALVNLSRLKEGERFADPFCGTGSLLIESSLMQIRTIGLEITRWIARGARMNLGGFSLRFESIIRNDSSFSLPFVELDGIATDVPYGRASSTRGLSTREILEGFLKSSASCIRSSVLRKKYCVVMHPSKIDIKEIIENQGNAFQLREQHLLYVHRNLTRAISILERAVE
jgi:tRNA (guanine10-N2)-dimethyltransferase